MREQRIQIKYKKCKFSKKLFNVILKNEQQKFVLKKHNNVEKMTITIIVQIEGNTR